ncbi:MaoC family dehydratase [Halomarina pelagica]|uniref:MaoC family dehydratase n=1 Tax=Halomarina pelagica TaxID=2961599 RepID=UPI0020C3B525|nr:MaoC family dehydratase [Halomarina sp. BND7]
MEYYEDIEVGDVTEHGSRTVTKAEIIEFATQYDPQSFHVDEEAAAESPYGGLIASGWHTASLCMRMLVDGVLGEQAGMGALGVDELRWYRPVRPGDTLSIETEVLEKRPSESDPSRGHVKSRVTGYNQDGEEVISWVGLGLVARREADD